VCDIVIDELEKPVARAKASAKCGPREAIAVNGFDNMSDKEKATWAANARLQSVLGSCAKSLPSVRSGIRCYFAFAGLFFMCCVRGSCVCLHSTSQQRAMFAAKYGSVADVVDSFQVRRHIPQLYGVR